jgi:hypothetical protein
MAPSIQRVILESIFVGLILIPITYVAAFLTRGITRKPALPEECKQWNKYRIMEINLFVAGMLFHLLMELSGFNKWYALQYIQP